MRAVAAILVALCVGCGSGGQDGVDLTDDGAEDMGALDPGMETGADLTEEDGGVPDPGPGEDLVTDDGPGEPEPVDPCPGAPGCACTADSECENDLCVQTLDTRACATPCKGVPDCPVGWGCGADAGTINYCKAPHVLCRPCAVEQDCNVGPLFDDYCFEFGPEGRFCVVACDGGSPCPDGYACTQVTHVRAVLTVCLPEGGDPCPCKPEYVEAGFATVCYVENEIGRCEAERTCDVDCPAPTPASEKCNGMDDDCNGDTDDGIGTLLCINTNEYGACAGVSHCLDGAFDNCDAKEPEEESCNGVDDDCDGFTDTGVPPVTCEKVNQWGTCFGQSDCEGGVFAECLVETPAQEACDGVDNDCDGVTDATGAVGCVPYCADEDEDGAGDPLDVKCLCKPEAPYTATVCADCDDGNPFVNPGATETCNGIDDDCDWTTDEEGAVGCTVYYFDNDGDGYSLTGNSRCLCEPFGKFTAQKLEDCNDTNAQVNPGAAEKCNGIDDDCDGDTDEGLPGC